MADKLQSFVFEEGEGAIAPSTSTPGALHEELKERVAAQTLAEAQRLLYVALTRAGKSLVLSYVTRSRPELAYEGDGITATCTARCAGLRTTMNVVRCASTGAARLRVWIFTI